jgi:hypothetical protein
MSASLKTVRAVREVLSRYLSRQDALNMLTDLKAIEGNASYHHTIALLISVLRNEK